MARINRKYYTEKSNCQMYGPNKKKRGHVYWRVLENNTWDCIWFDYKFKANDWLDVCRIVWNIRDKNLDKLEEDK